MFDYNKIMQKNTVVHCDTEEKAKKLLEWADSIGLKRHSGRSFKGVLVYTEGGTYYDLYYGYAWGISYAKLKEYEVLTYEEVLLNDFDLIYKIETGDFGNRCETIYCVDYKCYTKIYNGYTFDIDNSYINSFNLIYIGNNKGKDSFTLNKTEILTAFCELGADRNWKIKVIYDGEEYVYDWKTIPQAVKADGSPVYMSSKYTSRGVVLDSDFKKVLWDSTGDVIINKKGEDFKMAGIKAKVEAVVVNMNTKCEFKETVYVADEYLAYSVEDKYVKTVNKEMENVKKLTIDGKVIFEYEITTTENDTRKDWVKVRTKMAEIELKNDCNLMNSLDYEVEYAKLTKELSNYYDKIEYKVDWKLIK